MSWRDRAACRGMDDLFFPEEGHNTLPAKKVCDGCPVVSACLEYALETGQRYGVWGGTSEKERKRMNREASR